MIIRLPAFKKWGKSLKRGQKMEKKNGTKNAKVRQIGDFDDFSEKYRRLT